MGQPFKGMTTRMFANDQIDNSTDTTNTDSSRASLTAQFQAWNERSVQAAIEKGKLIKRGKEELSKEEWISWVVEDLHLKVWRADRYIQISNHPVLSDPQYGKFLPVDYRTLYELALIRDHKKLLEYIHNGGVHHDLKREAASKLKEQSNGKPKKDPLPPPHIPDHLQVYQNITRYFRSDKEWRAYAHHTPRPTELPSKEEIEAADRYVETLRLRMRGER